MQIKDIRHQKIVSDLPYLKERNLTKTEMAIVFVILVGLFLLSGLGN